MSKYSKSAEAINTSLLLWDVRHTETSIDDVEQITFYPINSIENSDIIEFDIPGFQYLMLRDVELLVKFNILTDRDVAPVENTNVSPINNFIHALWETVDVKINGFNVEQSMSKTLEFSFFLFHHK